MSQSFFLNRVLAPKYFCFQYNLDPLGLRLTPGFETSASLPAVTTSLGNANFTFAHDLLWSMSIMLMRNLLLLVCLSFFTVTSEAVADKEEPEQLTKLRNAYLDAHLAALKPVTEKYLAGLAKLREKFTKSGNLEAALIVQSEENGKNETPEANQPRQLITLNRIYKRAKDQESAKVTKKYVTALQSLQKKLTKSGDLSGAMYVKKECEKYLAKNNVRKAAKQGDKDKKWTKQSLTGTAWKSPEGDLFILKKGGDVRIERANGAVLTRDRWKLDEQKQQVIFYFPNSQNCMKLNSDGVTGSVDGDTFKLVK